MYIYISLSLCSIHHFASKHSWLLGTHRAACVALSRRFAPRALFALALWPLDDLSMTRQWRKNKEIDLQFRSIAHIASLKTCSDQVFTVVLSTEQWMVVHLWSSLYRRLCIGMHRHACSILLQWTRIPGVSGGLANIFFTSSWRASKAAQPFIIKPGLTVHTGQRNRPKLGHKWTSRAFDKNDKQKMRSRLKMTEVILKF